jgi:hypothetical protein
MASPRLRATLSTAFLVVGALLVGDALHGGVVTDQYALTSPAATLRLAGGVAAVAVGRRLRTPAATRAPTPADADSPRARADDARGDAEGSFDPALSPAGEALAEREESDDDRD